MSGVRLIQWSQQVGESEYEMLKRGNHLDRYLHGTASRALADRIVRDSAVQMQHIEPSSDDPWHGTRHVFRWTVGVADREVADAIAKQLAEARAEGLRDAAKIAADAANRYRRLSDGVCRHVLASSMDELAHACESAANAEVTRAHYAHPDQNACRTPSQVTQDDV